MTHKNDNKKNKYLSDYLPKIQRKVLYTEPIFLIEPKTQQPTYVADKTGGYSELTPVIMASDIKHDKRLFLNIAVYASEDFKSRSKISELFRYIYLGNHTAFPAIRKEDSILKNIEDTCKKTVSAYTKEFESVAYLIEKNANHTKNNILIIDFDCFDEKDAYIAAVIKFLYLAYTGKSYASSAKLMIENMKEQGYAIKANCVLTFPSGVVPIYGMLFSRTG